MVRTARRGLFVVRVRLALVALAAMAAAAAHTAGSASSAADTPPPRATAALRIPNALIVLEADPGTPGSEAWTAPPRFVLRKDGEVFVGGTGRLDSGRLDKAEVQALRRGAEVVRKAAGRGGALSFGGDERLVMRLRLPDDDPPEISLTGDPAAAPPLLQPAAAFVARLLSFDHPGLGRYLPAGYALLVREGRLVGGCRPWAFGFPIADAIAVPHVVSTAEAEGWPTGGWPASVCAGDKRYVVGLRPLLPGEQP